MYIVFGDCVALGSHQYALLLVDESTTYCCLYGISSLSSTSITSLLVQLKLDAGSLPHRFHSEISQEINRCKLPLMDTIKRFQHNIPSCWTPIYKCISRTHMAYFNPNVDSIHRREASRTRTLVPHGTPCSNDTKPGPWQIRPENHHAI